MFGTLNRAPYDVILADPPWRFRTWNETNQEKSASKHYDLMTLADIKAMPVQQLASSDCLLAMWAVQAMLDQALEVMRAWGFKFKTSGAWAKQSSTGSKWAFGTGYLFRCSAEFFLIGTRGNPRSAVRDVRNLIVAPVREHSRKPEDLHVSLERMFPDAKRCELFARAERPGWDAWGNQTAKFSPAAMSETESMLA
jgi:N6-adenosine-specific RNA methylase IME4